MPAAGDGELAGVVSFLRHQTEVLEEEKQLSRHEADRLRGEVATLKRTLDALRSQVLTFPRSLAPRGAFRFFHHSRVFILNVARSTVLPML